MDSQRSFSSCEDIYLLVDEGKPPLGRLICFEWKTTDKRSPTVSLNTMRMDHFYPPHLDFSVRDIWSCTCSSCIFTQAFTSTSYWQKSIFQQSIFGNTIFPLSTDTLEEDILTLNAMAVWPADLWEAEVCCKGAFHRDGFSWKPSNIWSPALSLHLSDDFSSLLFIFLPYLLAPPMLCPTTSTLLFPSVCLLS